MLPGSTPGAPDFKRVGPVGVERDGSAETAGAGERLEAGEGVGELVGITEGLLEQAVLGFAGECGSDPEGITGDGGGGADRVEISVERLQKGIGGTGWFRKHEGALENVVVAEGQRQGEGRGGALVGREAGAEGAETAAQEKEEWFESLEGVVEILGGVEMLRGTMQVEEALVFAVEDVVQTGCLGAESFRESLARKGGEISQGGNAPEVEQVVIQGKADGAGKGTGGLRIRVEGGERELREALDADLRILDVQFRVRVKAEPRRGPEMQGSQVGEVGRRSHGEMEGEAQRSGLAEGVLDPICGPGPGVGNRQEVEGECAGGGVFEIG